MIFWRIESHMLAKGWSTAYQLSKRANISRPGALRVLSGHPVERVDTATLEALAKAFDVEHDPLSLLEYRRR